MSRLTRDGTAEPVSRDQILRHARGQGNMCISLVQLTTSRIGNLTRLIHTLLYVMTIIRTYIHTTIFDDVLYVVFVLFLLYFLCPCMAINVSIQYNGGLLPDIILLTQCYYNRGTRLNAMKKFCICSL